MTTITFSVINSKAAVWTAVLKNTGTVVLVYNLPNGEFLSIPPGGWGTLEPLGDTTIEVKAGDIVVGTILFDATYPGSFSVRGGTDDLYATFDTNVSLTGN